MKKLHLAIILFLLSFIPACTKSIDIHKFQDISTLSSDEFNLLEKKLKKIDSKENINFIIPLKDHLAVGLNNNYKIIYIKNNEQLKNIISQMQQASAFNAITFIDEGNTIQATPGALSPVIINPQGGNAEIVVVPEYHKTYVHQAPLKKWLIDIMKANPDRMIYILREGAPYQGLNPVTINKENFDEDILESYFKNSRIGFSDLLALQYPDKVKIYGLCGKPYAEHVIINYKSQKYNKEIIKEFKYQSIVSSFNSFISYINDSRPDNLTESDIETIKSVSSWTGKLYNEALILLENKNSNLEKFLSLSSQIDEIADIISNTGSSSDFLQLKDNFVSNVKGFVNSESEFKKPEYMLRRDRDLFEKSAILAKQLHNSNKDALIILQIGAAHFYRENPSTDKLIPDLKPNVVKLLAENKDIRYRINNSTLSDMMKIGLSRDLTDMDSIYSVLNPVPDLVFFSYNFNLFNFPGDFINSSLENSKLTYNIYKAAFNGDKQIIIRDQVFKMYYSEELFNHEEVLKSFKSSDFFSGTTDETTFIATPSYISFKSSELPREYKTPKGYEVSLPYDLANNLKGDIASLFFAGESAQVLNLLDSLSKNTGIDEYEFSSSESVLSVSGDKIIIPSSFNLKSIERFIQSYNIIHKQIKDEESAIHAGILYTRNNDRIECSFLENDYNSRMAKWDYSGLEISKSPYLGQKTPDLLYDMIAHRNVFFLSISSMKYVMDTLRSSAINICEN